MGGDWQLWTITGSANVIIIVTYFIKVGLQWLWRRYVKPKIYNNTDETTRIVN
jgi:hypothetical protein